MTGVVAPTATPTMIHATIVNHVAVDIAVSGDKVWTDILEQYVEGRKFRDDGFQMDALDDPTAPLGGYRMVLTEDGREVDVREARFTEIDATARRLSIFADYLSPLGGMQVYVTYGGQEIAGGTRYTMDCHSRLALDVPAGASKQDVATATAQTTEMFQQALALYLDQIKQRLEAEI